MTEHDAASDPPAPRGLGGLVTTEVDRLHLGTHHGRDLHARVERRSARFSAGRQWHLAVGLGRTRPVAIEVSGPGERYDLSIVTADPWWRLSRRIGLVLGATGVALVIAGRLRGSRQPGR
ncbi:MAG: hypothetical protein O2822_00665 [Chloroflexi bacterium]|nr:hypothetical protein [Chloroflexota bacterium]